VRRAEIRQLFLRTSQPLTLRVADEDFGPFLEEVPDYGSADTPARVGNDRGLPL
jgi:hypothetical protein